MRLIDADKLFPDVMKVDGSMAISQGQLAYAHTVEAIPKADYENRLKADMVAMLTEILLEAEENTVRWYVGRVDGKSDDVVLMETLQEIIQQKINELTAKELNKKK